MAFEIVLALHLGFLDTFEELGQSEGFLVSPVEVKKKSLATFKCMPQTETGY